MSVVSLAVDGHTAETNSEMNEIGPAALSATNSGRVEMHFTQSSSTLCKLGANNLSIYKAFNETL